MIRSWRRFLPVLAVLALLASVSAAPGAQPADLRVYITAGGKHYHRSGCPYLGSSPIPLALCDAVCLGYSPCSACKPPRAAPPPAAIDAHSPLYRVNVETVETSAKAALGRMLRTVVVKHIDGDTIVVAFPAPPPGLAERERVRLLGVDAPALSRASGKPSDPGQRASEFTRQHLLHHVVLLAFDWDLRDRYGRLLAYVYLPDGACFNAELLREGYAHAYTRFPFQFLEEFRALEREARRQKRGLWPRGE
jgi:endonuclease YncB( thermonuclease family)